jgi:hypothetical protein
MTFTGTNRLTLPEEYFDITSSLILRAPEPQYPYAVLWKMAFKKGLERRAGGIGLLPGRLAGGHGAPFPDVQQFESKLDDPILSEAFMVIPDEAKVGHTVRMNRPRFPNTTYTQVVREVTRQTISTTPISIASEQVAVTIKQWAGPYDNVNSRVAPFGLDAFDASRAVHDLALETGTHLQRDFDRTIDSFISNLIDLCDPLISRTSSTTGTVYASTAISADNSYTTAGSGPMSYDMLIRGIENLRLQNIPPFADGRYCCVLGPTECAELAADDEWQRQSVFVPQANPLIAAAYQKSIQGVNVYLSNTLNTYSNSSSVNVRRNHMFGPGVLGGIVVPVSGQGGVGPRVQASTSDNYGLQALVIWVLEAGFQIFDSRFGVTLRTA